MMDVNADVGTSMFVRDLADIGIVSALRRAHKGPYPATYNRGSSQIDDIFVSASLPITQCGLFPFGDAPGDHRGVYVDIPITAVEGETRDRIQRVPKRRLVTSKPKVVKKFNELFLQQLNRNHIPQRVEHLKRTFHVPLTQYERTQYEKIDRIILSAFRYAEKRCRKLKCGKVEYSPELNALGREGHLWDLVFKKLCGCKVSSSLIRRLAKKCHVECPVTPWPGGKRKWFLKDTIIHHRLDYGRLSNKLT